MRASEGADQPTELTRDHLRLRDQLLALEPSSRPADTTRALARAAQLLAASSHARKTVFLIVARRADRLPRRRAAVGQGRPGARCRSSCARRRCRTSRSPRCTSIPIRAPAAAAPRSMPRSATSATRPRKVELQLAIGDRVVARGTLEVAAGERKPPSASSRCSPPARARPTPRSRSPATRSPIDDRRWVRASLRDEVRVLLVDGDPRTVRRDDELFYLEAALRPGDREDSGTRSPHDHGRGARRHRSEAPRRQLGDRAGHARDRPRRVRRRRARERRRRSPPSASRCSPTGCAPAAASSSRPAITSIPPRTTRRCCRCCRSRCAIRSTRPGAPRPTIATAARSTS